jgi:hypothetical protein
MRGVIVPTDNRRHETTLGAVDFTRQRHRWHNKLRVSARVEKTIDWVLIKRTSD